MLNNENPHREGARPPRPEGRGGRAGFLVKCVGSALGMMESGGSLA